MLAGSERPGVLVKDMRLDVSSFCRDFDEAFFGGGGVERLRAWIEQSGATCPVVPDTAPLGPCIARPSKIICIGMNYAKHARAELALLPAGPANDALNRLVEYTIERVG